MTSSPSQLWALIAAHQSATGVSTNELARRIGVSRQTLADWRTSGLIGRVPKRSTLTGVADAIGKPYRTVLEAALADAGYLDDAAPTYESVFADAVAALTAATQLRRRSADESRPSSPIDWAAFVCEATAAAAANRGGTELALAGRPGSWEAGHVGAILSSTLGPDDDFLWDHRTVPVTVSLPLAGILDAIAPEYELSYENAQSALKEPYQQALARFRAAGVLPEYPVVDVWSLPLEEQQAVINAPTVLTAEEQALRDLEEEEERLLDQLAARRIEELTVYGRRLAAALERRLRAFVPPSVPITIEFDAVSESYDYDGDLPPVYVDEAFGPVEEAVAAAIGETAPPPLFDRPNA